MRGSRRFVLGAGSVFAFVAGISLAQISPDDGPDVTCQILDSPVRPVYRVSLGYIGSSDFEGGGSSSATELDADWYFAHLREGLYGEGDFNLKLRTTFWSGSADIHLPGQLVQLALDAGWTWRYEGGMGFQVRVMPGIYSDVDESSSDMFAMPFSFAVVRAFDPSLSGMVGAWVRPDFDRVVMPMFGVEWEISDVLRLQLRVPESRFTWFVDKRWAAHVGLSWQDTTYALAAQGAFDRRKMSVEDLRACLGATYRLSDEISLVGEVGSVFNRSVKFEDDAPAYDGDIEVDSAGFMRVAVVGPF